jgi:hypothetical protein
VYRFKTLSTGTLSLEFHIDCDRETDDSWYITVDDQPFFTWNNNSTDGWEWRSFPQTYEIEAGPHTLTVDEREDGAKMAGIRLILSSE